jgi:hypothetical protein
LENNMKGVKLNTAKSAKSLNDAREYLVENGFFVPDFDLVLVERIGGSFVTREGSLMHFGCYPGERTRNWFAMHELIHVLSFYHLGDEELPAPFDEPAPDRVPNALVRMTMSVDRPWGFPSKYALRGGGEEFLAEMYAYMYCMPDGFADEPPRDLRDAWAVAWELSERMESA